MTASFILNSTAQSGKKLQKTFTNVNPETTNANAAELGQRFNALTTNVYGKTDRINKINCDTEGPTQTPTLTLSSATMAQSNFQTSNNFKFNSQEITYTGDGEIYSDDKPDNVGVEVIDVNGTKYLYVFWNTNDAPTLPFTFTVKARETATYKAASKSLTIADTGGGDAPPELH